MALEINPAQRSCKFRLFWAQSSCTVIVAREEEQVDALLEKAEELRAVVHYFIKAWEDLHDNEFEYEDAEI